MEKLFTLIIGILTLIVSFSGIQRKNDTYSLTIEVSDLRNNNGRVALQLYNGSKGFPEGKESAVKSVHATISSKKAKTIIYGLTPGDYAIALLHDENKNNKMDKSFVGIPQEGFGFSKNPKVKFSAPSFDDCKIKLGSSNKDITIKIIYF